MYLYDEYVYAHVLYKPLSHVIDYLFDNFLHSISTYVHRTYIYVGV